MSKRRGFISPRLRDFEMGFQLVREKFSTSNVPTLLPLVEIAGAIEARVRHDLIRFTLNARDAEK